MKLATLVTAATLTLATGAALAADQSVSFAGNAASFDGTAPILQGGDDVITFTGLAPGLYDFTLSMSAQGLTLTSATLNGMAGAINKFGNITWVGLESSGQSPFALTLVGSLTPNKTAIYSGELTVAAVPEPETYAMMLAGLGALAYVGSRRRRQAA